VKIIISGHKGFLGSALVNKLQLSHDVMGISKSESHSNSQIKEYKSSELITVKEKPDVLIMCHAAVSNSNTIIETQLLFDSNVAFTADLIKQFPESYFLFISSISVYGHQEISINENSQTSPLTEYAISKLWGEQIVRKTKRHGILRLSSVFGENMKENTIIPNYVNQAMKNGVIEVWGNGERRQNYFHVSDAVAYIEMIITNKIEGVFLGTSSKEFSNIELANIISKETSATVKLVNSDNSKSFAFDNKSTREILGITSEKEFTTGIKEYIYWKQKQS
jgi:UDP-glucose 4-epimerase